MFSRLLPAAALLGCLAASPAPAQEFFGLQHTPAGTAELTMTPTGLSINNLGSTGKDGVDTTIPPPPAESSRQAWFGHIQDLQQPGLDSSLVLGCIGTGASGTPETACTMQVEYLAGVPTVSFDFSGVQPSTVRFVYYSHDTVLAEVVMPAPVVGPFPLTASPVLLNPMHGFSAHFVFTCHCWVFDWTWDTSLIIMPGGGVLLGCDRVEVYAEAPQVEFDTFDTVSMRIDGPSSVNVTFEHVESEVDACPCDFAPPFGQLDFSDVIGFLQCFSASCP